MSDPITRHDAIDALKICDSDDEGANCHACPLREKRWNGAWYDGETNCHEKLMRDSAKLLELPFALQWIPCSEQLPESEDMVLVTCRTKKGVANVNRAYYENGFWHGSGSMSGVIAWMPLPDPYEEVEE